MYRGSDQLSKLVDPVLSLDVILHAILHAIMKMKVAVSTLKVKQRRSNLQFLSPGTSLHEEVINIQIKHEIDAP